MKGIKFLNHVMLIISPICLLGATTVNLGTHIVAAECWIFSLCSYAFMPVSIANLVLLAYWLIYRHLALAMPLAALLLNFTFITAIFQIDIKVDKHTEDKTIKIISYNLKAYTEKGADSLSSDELVEGINNFILNEKADIVCLQEYNSTKCSVNELSEVFKTSLPYIVQPIDCKDMANIILSRYPIVQSGRDTFPASRNGYMWAELQLGNEVVRVVNLHLQTTMISSKSKDMAEIKKNPFTKEGRESIKSIIVALKENTIIRQEQFNEVRPLLTSDTLPVIVVGDFNEQPASYIYRSTLALGLRDGFKEAGSGYMYTYKNLRKLLRIDYIFGNKLVDIIDYQTCKLPYSDHNPVIASFDITH